MDNRRRQGGLGQTQGCSALGTTGGGVPPPPHLDLPTNPPRKYWTIFSSGPSANQKTFSGAFGAN